MTDPDPDSNPGPNPASTRSARHGRRGWWLDELDGALEVAAGTIDVFWVPFDAEGKEGVRRHLARFDASALVFGVPPTDPARPARLLAVATEGADVRPLSSGLLRERAAGSDSVALMAGAMGDWVLRMSGALDSGLGPTRRTELTPNTRISLAEGEAADPEHGLVWCLLSEGEVTLSDVQDFKFTAGPALIPVSESLWLNARSAASLEVMDPVSAVLGRDPSECLVAFHRLLLNWSAEHMEREAEAEVVRLQNKAESKRRALSQAVGGLASLTSAVPGAKPHQHPGESPLLAACRVVGDCIGVTIRAPAGTTEGFNSMEGVDRLAKASRIRVRRVVLPDRWWTLELGPFLAFDAETNQPLAALPVRSGEYEIVDPAGGTRVRVSGADSARVRPTAVVFYRSFPHEILNGWKVFRFGLVGARNDLWSILIMGLAGGLLGLFFPIFTGLIFDSVIPGADRGQLWFLCLVLVVASVSGTLFQVTRRVALLRLETRSDGSIQAAVWDRLLGLPLPFFRKYTAGDLASRAGGITEIRRILSGAVLSSLLGGLFAVFNFLLLFYYSGSLALIATGLVLVSIAVTTVASMINLSYLRPIYRIEGRLSGQVLQFVTGITKLRVAGAEPYAYAEWARGFSAQKALDVRAGRLLNGFAVFHVSYPLLTTIVLFGAMAFWSESRLSTGSFLAFSAAFGGFLSAMLATSEALLAVMEAVPLYERARPIMEALPEVKAEMSDPGELTGRIELNQVAFRYQENGPLILDDVSFQVKPGEFVAVVGPSGSGKSTLLRLLLGFELPDSGTIYYDGLDLAGLDIQALRRQLGVVLQSGKLMPGDIYQNIVGNSARSLDDAWFAAEQAGFAEDIRRMPMGMHTVLSEGAGTLSGGQRQRLMIARAIVGRPRILMFDEATSALDNRTQATVSESLDHMQSTRIVIAHRLSTIRHADQILVLKQGRIVQQGTYDSLLKESGPFADLALRQLA